jgi:hypothetical protein
VSTLPCPPPAHPRPALAVLPMPALDAAGKVARLDGATLYLNPAASAADQLAAVADAVRVLQGERPRLGRQVRHLRAVPAAGRLR